MKSELVQTLDLLALDRGLEGEVEGLQGLDRWQAGGAHRGLQPPVVAQGDLRREQPVNGIRGCHTAAVDVAEDAIDGFE